MKKFTLFLFTLLFLLSCSDSDSSSSNNLQDVLNDSDTNDTNEDINENNNNNNNNNNNKSELWNTPDAEGRITENNLLNFEPEMYIVTSSNLTNAWKNYEIMKNLEGINTKIITIEEIKSSYEGVDDAEKLRNFLKDKYETGNLRFVLLGGDAEVVPFRRIYSSISIIAVGDFTTNGPAEVYFSNLESNFDSDNDEIFGEKDEDLTLEEIKNAQIAVGRIPVSYENEVLNYYNKVYNYRHITDGSPSSTLLMSDIATTLPLIGDVDAAEGVETTFSEFFPDSFKSNVTKLYATEVAATTYGGEVFTVPKAKNAIENGKYMIFHNGHGSHSWLTNELNSDFVLSLQNDVPSVLASCSCLAGNFADWANADPPDQWQEQAPDEDSAGELLIVSEHGSVAYLGNTGAGLGALGGSQFLHAFYKAIFSEGINFIGEAFNYGRAEMRNIEYHLSGISSIMTDDSEWWTHLVVILLGDPSLKVWTQFPISLYSDDIPTTYSYGWQTMSFTVKNSETDVPLQDATVILYKENDFILKQNTDSNGKVEFNFIPMGKNTIKVGISIQNAIPTEYEITPID